MTVVEVARSVIHANNLKENLAVETINYAMCISLNIK